MIIPNQYNGFDYQGRRVYNVGGGVGEAMLIGAAMGAGTSAITGQDPLKGAAFGALGGGAMSGLGGLLGGAEAGAGVASSGQVAGQLGAGAATGAGSQAAQLAAQTGEFGLGGLQSLAGSAAVNPYAAAGQQLATQAPISAAGFTPSTGFTDIFKSTPGGPAFGERVGNYIVQNPGTTAAAGASAANMMLNRPELNIPGAPEYSGPLSQFRYDPRTYNPYIPSPPRPPYRAQYAKGGITELAVGGGLNAPTGPVERMSQGVVGAGGMYPQSQMDKTYFATPTQMPASAEVIGADYDVRTNPYTGAMMASGGIADLGSYSDGGRLLKGPGDGMSDSIPAKIGSRQPARLADGEFVVPADVVSHLGNGSTDAGAKQLYTMMDRVRKTRTGTKRQGREINPGRYMPA